MKRLHVATLGLGLSFFIIFLLFFFLVVHANPPVRIFSVVIEPEIAYPGDSVTMRISYCKYTDVDSSFSTFWRRRDDGLVWGMKHQPSNIGLKGCRLVATSLILPNDIPPGEWQRVNIGTYKVNPLASRTAGWESNYIEVRER
jgi:hypothetical protein